MISILQKRYFVKGACQILFAAMVIAVAGCNGETDKDRKDCIEAGGTLIDCYSGKDNPDVPGGSTALGQYCTEKSVPPCICLDATGSIDQLPQFKLKDECVPVAGTGGITKPVITIASPYKKPAGTLPLDLANDIKPQYVTFYVDRNLDLAGRPSYFFFSIEEFDLDKYDYSFEFDQPLGDPSAVTLTKDGLTNNASLRELSYTNCAGTSCGATGTIKMDLRNAKAGNYPIYMYRTEKISPYKKVRLAFTIFGVQNEETFNGTTVSRRKFDMKILTGNNSKYNLANMTAGGRSLKLALNYVYGIGKANIEVVASAPTRIASTDLAWTPDDILALDYNDFTHLNDLNELDGDNDIAPAVGKAVKRLYEKYLPNKRNNSGFALAVYFINAYNISSYPLKSWRSDFMSYAGAKYGTLGVTYNDRRIDSYCNGTIIFMKNLQEQVCTPMGSKDYCGDAGLTTLLHEMGHMWTLRTSDNGAIPGPGQSRSCAQHISFCNGIGKGKCLFQSNCFDNIYANGAMAYETESRKNPFFCEGHQQILMNRFAKGE